jgi:hypothetical protein
MYSDILREQLQINMNGMILLLVWAILNIVVGVILSHFYKHKQFLQHFFQMNALWNIVNLLVAGAGIYILSQINPAEMELKAIIYTVFTFEKLLLLNAGLSIAYIAIGSYLVERGLHHKSTVLQGFGKSLWLQGGFLFILSILLYFLNTGYNQRYSIFILF